MSAFFRVFRRCINSEKHPPPKNGSAISTEQTQLQPVQPDSIVQPLPSSPVQPAGIPAASPPALNPTQQAYATPAGAPVSLPGPVQPAQSFDQTARSQAPIVYNPAGPNVSVSIDPISNPIFLRALFSFEGQTQDDLTFKKGDRLFLLRLYASQTVLLIPRQAENSTDLTKYL